MSDSLLRLKMEANDNVRFLASAEKFLEPLYRKTPVEITEYLPQFMTLVRNIFLSSTFFNTTEQAASFLSKVTNQVIVASQNYLTNNKQSIIWNESMDTLVCKINDCLSMQDAYRMSYEKIIYKLEHEDGLVLKCSKSFLFDRLLLFNDRLNKICDIMETCLRYRVLHKYKIGGMEPLIERIERAFDVISKKSYNPLFYRETPFEKDFCAFKKEIIGIEIEMETFVMDYVNEIPTVDQRILALNRFEKLHLVCLRLPDRYIDLAKLFFTEMEEIKDKYNEDRASPPIPRGVPPFVGRIMWIRFLQKRIKEPIKFIRNYECLFDNEHIIACIKFYNFLSPLFLEYEKTTHKAWYDFVNQVRTKLEQPILRKNPVTNYYEVNLEPYVMQVIKETEYMQKVGLDIPKLPLILAYSKDHIINAYNQTKDLVRRNNQLRMSIYPIFLPLMRIHLARLERIFAPALSQITWLTFEIEKYFTSVNEVLTPVENFVKDISDTNDSQIEALMQQISQICLVYMPDEPVPPMKLLELNEDHRREMAKIIEIKTMAAEKAVVNLINKFVEKAENIPLRDNSGKFALPMNEWTDRNRRNEELKPIDKYDWLSFEKIYKAVGYASPEDNVVLCFKEYDGLNYDVTLLHIDCVELFAHYNHQMITALTRCTKRSMENLKARSRIIRSVKTFICNEPLLTATMILKIPNFLMIPDIFEIQRIYNAVILNMTETFYAVPTWGRQAKTAERKTRRALVPEIRHEKNWFKIVAEHKEVSSYRITFDKGISQLEPDIRKILDDLKASYEYLWSSERDEMIEQFVQSNPLTVEIREKLLHYNKITDDIYKLEPVLCAGLIKIDRSDMINKLAYESKLWKTMLGQKLCKFYQVVLDEKVEFIDERNKILSREIDNLDDCRIAMDCLKVVREHFIEMDSSLVIMEQAYNVFEEFKLDIPDDDFDKVSGLRYEFDKMIERSQKVAAKLAQMQGPLQDELETGVLKFQQEVQKFDQDFIKNGPMVEGIPAREASDRVLLFDAKITELQYKQEMFMSGEKLFGLPVNDYPILIKRKRDISYLNRLYKLYLDVMNTIDEYFVLHFTDVDMEQINAEIQEFVNRCRTLPKAMKNWPAFIELKKKIDDFYECCPILELMASKAMKLRHWEMLQKAINYIFNTEDENFTLKYVMEAPLMDFKDDIEEICVGANKELDIELKLQTVIKDWKEINMPLAAFKSRGDLLIKASDVLDIITKLEDSLMIMNSLASNRFNGPFKKDIVLWLKKLNDTSVILERWLGVQSLYMYLEAVFVGGDISRQLPQEAKRFGIIDQAWVKIMYKTRDVLNIIEICTGDDVVSSTLLFLVEQLELCQKSLTVYLESKRLIFPRFFFISDPVLLEILGQASDPNSIQPHLLSLFDGVARVEFDKQKKDTIMAMMSSNGEKIPLETPVRCVGLVEIWIGRLLESVLDTMKKILGTLGLSISDEKFDYKNHLSMQCAQAQMICIQLIWTKNVEYALNYVQLDRRIMTRKNLETQDMLDYLVDQTVKDLTKLERICSETLVTIHVHQRDIFDDLVKLKIKVPTDFEWQKQARFYYDLNLEDIIVKITDVDFIYQNEYLGVTERLAITPLTDRCYITLAQAIGMNMGGAPAG